MINKDLSVTHLTLTKGSTNVLNHQPFHRIFVFSSTPDKLNENIKRFFCILDLWSNYRHIYKPDETYISPLLLNATSYINMKKDILTVIMPKMK